MEACNLACNHFIYSLQRSLPWKLMFTGSARTRYEANYIISSIALGNIYSASIKLISNLSNFNLNIYSLKLLTHIFQFLNLTETQDNGYTGDYYSRSSTMTYDITSSLLQLNAKTNIATQEKFRAWFSSTPVSFHHVLRFWMSQLAHPCKRIIKTFDKVQNYTSYFSAILITRTPRKEKCQYNVFVLVFQADAQWSCLQRKWFY